MIVSISLFVSFLKGCSALTRFLVKPTIVIAPPYISARASLRNFTVAGPRGRWLNSTCNYLLRLINLQRAGDLYSSIAILSI
jgi:hypothetical protein